jgi:hypothetical protein
MDPVTADILKPVIDLFKKQGYSQTQIDFCLQSFMASAAMNCEDDVSTLTPRRLNVVKTLDQDTGTIQLISVIALGDPKIADNYYVVGIKTTKAHAAKQDEFELCPPLLKLKDFLERSKDQDLVKVFDGFPRINTAHYTGLKLTAIQNG